MQRRRRRNGRRRSAAASSVSRPMAPSEASAKGWRLTSVSCGSWSEWMMSMVPARRPSIIACRSSSERSGGRQLEEGAVGADVVLVERQIVDRDAGRRCGSSARLAAAIDLDRSARSRSAPRGSGRRSVRRAAGRGPAGWSRPRAGMPLRPRMVAKRPSFITPSPARLWSATMVDDRQVEVGGVAEGGAEQGARLDRLAAIGEADGAGFLAAGRTR